MKFFLGTTNPGKIREIGSILTPLGCELEVTDPIDPEETEPDFLGNAILKAKCYAAHAGGLTISEDSGLAIASLNGLPGVHSARFADCEFDVNSGTILKHSKSGRTREEIDALNNDLVLSLMKDVPIEQRQAAFVVVLVVATAQGEILFSQMARCEGSIALEKRGTNGFGYDPIFEGKDSFGKTNAELDSLRKNLRSHRKVVLDAFQAWLASYLSTVVS